LFTLLPFVELYLLIRIGTVVGTLPTLGFVIGIGITGAILARSQGRRVLSELQLALAEGRMPTEAVLSGVLILIGGVLLITPGVITDFVGLLLLFPPSRRLLMTLAQRQLEARIQAGTVQVQSYGFGPPTGHMGHDVRGAPRATRSVRPSPTPRGDVIDTHGEEVP
jgi:UPF0716 protein FxsA